MLIHEVTLKEAKLPLNKIKGSMIERKNKVDHTFLRFYRELNPLCNGIECSVENFKKSIDKILEPNNINYIIKKEQNNKFKGSLGNDIKLTQSNFYEININHIGFSIYLPMNEDGSIIKNKYTAFHEIRHFFDHLYNPKYSLLRCSNAVQTENGREQTDKLRQLLLINLNFPAKIKKIITEAEAIINQMPNSVAIDALQDVRCSLQTEINAYKEELNCKYKDGLYAKALEIKAYMLTNFKFKSKLKYVNNKLKEIIATEREILRKQYNKQ